MCGWVVKHTFYCKHSVCPLALTCTSSAGTYLSLRLGLFGSMGVFLCQNILSHSELSNSRESRGRGRLICQKIFEIGREFSVKRGILDPPLKKP
jgi:hypothetical protein